MTDRLIDAGEALELLEKAVLERGEDWSYPKDTTCMYFYDRSAVAGLGEEDSLGKAGVVERQPACLVGQVLSYVGMTSEIVDDHHNELGIEDLVSYMSWKFDIKLTKEAELMLKSAQYMNDISSSWGFILRSLRIRYANGEFDVR